MPTIIFLSLEDKLMLAEPTPCFVAVVWPYTTKTKSTTNRISPLVCQNVFIHFSLFYKRGSEQVFFAKMDFEVGLLS